LSPDVAGELVSYVRISTTPVEAVARPGVMLIRPTTGEVSAVA